MSYELVKMKDVPSGSIWCLKHTTDGVTSTTTYSDCVFVPDVDYPDLSKIQVITSSTGWIDNYDEFQPKIERLFVDLLFIFFLFIFIWLLLKNAFKIFFK